MSIVFSKNIEKFRNSMFVDPSFDPFYLFTFAIGIAIALIYPASLWVGLMFMAMTLIPIINRALFGDREDAFYEEFDQPTFDVFIKNFTRVMLKKGATEYDIASDVYTLKTVWCSGDGAATMIGLMHLQNKLEAFSDVSDLQQTLLPSVHPSEDSSGPDEDSVPGTDDGSGLPKG